MGTVRQSKPQRNENRQARWHRLARADLLEQYLDLRAQGISQRQAAQPLEVPRTTLQAWQVYQERLDEEPAVVAFLQSPPGLAFLHRLVIGLHLVCTEVGACGIRLAGLLMQLTGLDRFIGAFYGTQQQVNRQVEAAIVVYGREESPRLATDMPAKAMSVAPDETFTGGLCLVAMDPESNSLLLEETAQGRDQDTWNTLMEQALSGLNGHIIQSTSDEAPGLLAYVDHHLGAHHSPDLFHVQHALRKAVCAPMATKERAATKAVTKARERLEQVQTRLPTTDDESPRRGPGRPPKAPMTLEQAQQALDAATREHERLAQQREQMAQSIRGIGHAYHVVDLERGVRRNGQLITER